MMSYDEKYNNVWELSVEKIDRILDNGKSFLSWLPNACKQY